MNIFKSIKNYIKNSEGSQVGMLLQSLNLRSSNKNWQTKDFYNAYEQNLYFAKGIDKRAEKVGQIEFKLESKNQVITEEADNEFLNLLKNPNPLYSSGDKFWAMRQKHLDLSGQSFIKIEAERNFLRGGKINYKDTKLWLLQPENVTVNMNKSNGEITSFTYTEENTGTQEKLEPWQVIYEYNNSVRDQLQAVTKMLAGKRTLDTDNQLSEYMANIIENGGKVDGVISFKADGLTRQQLQEIKDDYRKNHADAKKSGSPLFLGGDAKYERMALSGEELGYLDSKKMTLNDVVILTGVPKILLGAVDNIKYSNAQESAKVFLKETIQPIYEDLVKVLQNHNISENNFRSFVPEGFTLGFVNNLKEDTEITLKKVESGTKNYYMTINERRELLGLEPIKNGDDIYKPMNLMPIDEPVKQEAKSKSIDKKKEFKHPLRDKGVRQVYGKYKVAKEEKNEKIFKKEVNKYFEEQKERLLSKIKSLKSKNIIDENFNQAIEVKVAIENLGPLLEEFLKESGQDTYALMGGDYSFNLSGNIASWLQSKKEVFAQQINDTTFKTLQKEMQASLEAGETRKQLTQRIEKTYSNITKSRAATIARTEVGGVMTKGTFEAYEQMDIPIKIWVSVNDSNTRSSHASVDGEEKPLRTPFSNGLQYPREAGAPAEEIINCRCQI